MKRLLSARAVAALTEPGRYAVGHGAYLQISEWRTRSWIFRYARNGKARHVGMGSCDYVTLSEARERAIEYRRMLARGEDPFEAKRAGTRAASAATERAKTFKWCALEFIKQHEKEWRGDASRRQWIGSLEQHAFPRIGDKLIGDIDAAAVLSVLDPLRDRLVTARRVKNRLALILDWAAERDLRERDNPAKRNLLPKRKKHQVVNLPGLPYTTLPAFMPELRQRSEMSARALEFEILCAARPGEVLGARWSEIKLAEAIWVVPGERMKAGREHRVPLSGRAVELLANLPREGEYVFPGHRTGGRMYTNALTLLLQRMGHPGISAHATARASFKTWGYERTNFPRELIEAALAHIVGDEAEKSYLRGDALARRRQLMEAWSEYCSKPDTANGVIVPLRTGALA
jgi:integrase